MELEEGVGGRRDFQWRNWNVPGESEQRIESRPSQKTCNLSQMYEAVLSIAQGGYGLSIHQDVFSFLLSWRHPTPGIPERQVPSSIVTRTHKAVPHLWGTAEQPAPGYTESPSQSLQALGTKQLFSFCRRFSAQTHLMTGPDSKWLTCTSCFVGSIPGTPPACAFQQCLAVCCFVNFWIYFHGKVSEVAEDSLLAGWQQERSCCQYCPGWYWGCCWCVVCFWRLLLKETVWELTPLVAFGLARQTVEF